MASIATPKSANATQRMALLAGAAAIIGMGALTACSSGTTEQPPATTAPPPSTTVKAVNPGINGSFTPSVKPRQGPTAMPGNIVTGG